MKTSTKRGHPFGGPLDHLADKSYLHLEIGNVLEGKFCPCRLWTGPVIWSRHKLYGRLSLYRNWPEMKKPSKRNPPADRLSLRTHRIALMMYDLLKKYPHFDWSKQEWKDVFFRYNEELRTRGVEADHMCQETLCIQPKHLEWVTPRENQLRMQESARRKRKEAEWGRLHAHMHGSYANYAETHGQLEMFATLELASLEP